MSERYRKLLSEHTPLAKRRTVANRQLDALRHKFSEYSEPYTERSISVYCAGSVARGEVGVHSDLDLFLLRAAPQCDWSRLDELELLANVIGINRDLGYGPLSNDGQYLKVYPVDQMLDALGAPQDDSENLFTARALLLLESRPVCNESLYDAILDDVLEHYFRDRRGKRSFRPLFLLNDLLRYWRTLCLNYELIRDNPHRPWGKKT